MQKELSCGFIVRAGGKLLACHATGHGRISDPCSHDIAKGHNEDGETPLETAKRELREETGIDIDKENLEYEIRDFGRLPYIKTKDLYVFLLDLKNFDIERTLTCSTYYEMNGKTYPEMDGYVWTTDISLYFKSLQHVFRRLKEEAGFDPLDVKN